MSPNEKVFEYPSLIKRGKKSPPKASMVTPEPPVKAVKKPQRSTRITGVPPGIHPNKDLNNLTSLSDALLSARIYPARVNNGIVGNVGETTILYASAEIADKGVQSRQNKKTANPPNPIKIGAPLKSDNVKIKITIHIKAEFSRSMSKLKNTLKNIMDMIR